MQRIAILFMAALMLGTAPRGSSDQHPPPAPALQATIGSPVTVPEGNGAPVITDGLFSQGEWDDSLRIALNEAVTLHLKEYRGVVFIGVRGQGPAGIGPSELFLSAPGGSIQKLHVSAQLFEVALPPAAAEPPPRFGLTTDWYANELRRDVVLAGRLEKEGKSPIDVIRAASYPGDGIEFAIRRSKFPGRRWLMRLSASALVDGKPGMLVYPVTAEETTTKGWLELRLGQDAASPDGDSSVLRAGPAGQSIVTAERAVVETTIRDSIGWALTKDRARLESVLTHDDDLFIVHPDSKSTVQGWEAFSKMIPQFMDPRFKATGFDVKDLATTFSSSGDVAWFSGVLEDCGEWDGKASCWKDTRWTGVLERRDGRWVIVQMHFSFAKDKVLEECQGAGTK